MRSFLSILYLLAIFAIPVLAADANTLFSELPTKLIAVADRRAAVQSAETDVLMIKTPGGIAGVFKIIKSGEKETLVGLTLHNCEESSLEFWSKSGSRWTNVTEKVAPKLSAKDVMKMLAASPVTIERVNESVSVAYFFEFAQDNGLNLVMRKQTGCDVAGVAEKYEFNGRRYVVRDKK